MFLGGFFFSFQGGSVAVSLKIHKNILFYKFYISLCSRSLGAQASDMADQGDCPGALAHVAQLIQVVRVS